MKGQEIKDILKERIRKSIITSGMPPIQNHPFQIEQQRQRENVLKVSPFTKLPTKGDRILIMQKQEKTKNHMQNFPTNSSPIKKTIAPTNSSPINMRLIGSAEHVIVGKPWRIYTNPAIYPAPGMLVVPSGRNFDPTYVREERRHARTDRLVKAYNNDW